MSEIVVVGDIHEGIGFGFKIDPDTGISGRAMDVHRSFVRAAEYALENDVKLFVILGDLFHRSHISPTFRELVRADVIEPLGAQHIPVWIIAGNHDQPHSWARSTSLDDYRGYPHVKVFRKPELERFRIDDMDISFLIIPYLHPEQIAKRVEEEEDIEVQYDQRIPLGQKVIKRWLEGSVSASDADINILLAHYYIDGARLRETAHLEILPDEFKFTKDMIPRELDMAIFSHVHLHQCLFDYPPTVYTGAVERVDWGERDDPKGFVVLEFGGGDRGVSWRFEPLPVRDMVKVEVNVDSDSPTEQVLKCLPSDVRGKMVRLEIVADEGARMRIDGARIEDRLRDAFHYEVRWITDKAEKFGYQTFTMNPYELFTKYIEINYSKHDRYEMLLKEGKLVLEEVLEQLP